MVDGNGSVSVRLTAVGGEMVKRTFDEIHDKGRRALAGLASAGQGAAPGLRAVNTLSESTRDALDGLAASGGPVGRALAQIGPLGLAAGAALGGLALGLQQAREAMQFGQELEEATAAIGLNTDAIQEWRFVARESGVDVGTMDAALAAFTRTLGAATSGISREALQAFERLGFTREQLDGYHTAEAALEAVIDRVAGLGDAAEQAAIAQKLNIESILPVLRQGADAIARLREEARELGVVMDAELVSRAADAEREFDTLSQVIDIQLKSAFVDLAPVLIWIMGLVADLARELGEAADAFRRIEDRSRAGLQTTIDVNQRHMSRILDEAGVSSPHQLSRDNGEFGGVGLSDGQAYDHYAARAARAEAELAMRDFRTFWGGPTGGGGALQVPPLSERRPGGGGGSAEAEARRAELRRRAIEDLAAEIDLIEARERGDQASLRLLERQNDERRFTRRLLDQGATEDEARVQVAEIMGRLDAARAEALADQEQAAARAYALERAREDEAWDVVRAREREAEIEERVQGYLRLNRTEEEARAEALADQAVFDEIRERRLGRWLDQQAQAHELTLAQLGGEQARARELERELAIRERIEELQKAGVELTQAEVQARREDDDRERARLRGQFREGAREFVAGLVEGDLRGFWEGLADRFTDRMVDRLTDDLMSLFDMLAARLGQANLGGKGGAGGFDLIGTVLGFFGAGSGAGSGLGKSGFGSGFGGGLPGFGKGGFGAPAGTPAGLAFDPFDTGGKGGADGAPAMSFSFTYAPSYDVRGSGEELAALRRDMDRDRREFDGRVIRTVQQAQARSHGEVFDVS